MLVTNKGEYTLIKDKKEMYVLKHKAIICHTTNTEKLNVKDLDNMLDYIIQVCENMPTNEYLEKLRGKLDNGKHK